MFLLRFVLLFGETLSNAHKSRDIEIIKWGKARTVARTDVFGQKSRLCIHAGTIDHHDPLRKKLITSDCTSNSSPAFFSSLVFMPPPATKAGLGSSE
jgi:hypothetical protein